MSRFCRVRLVVAAAVAMALAWPSTAARAEPQSWSYLRCANGAMTADGTVESTLTVWGWIRPCQSVPVIPASRFAVVYYGPDFAVPGELLAYDGGTDWETSFARTIDTTQLGFPLRAVCLVFRPDAGRIACVGGAEAGLPELQPIPTGNPVVLVPVRWNNPVMDHFCGTCV